MWTNYTTNIKKTVRHKVAYAIDEYRQFGYNTTDCITHDSEKLIGYFVGVPHDKMAKFHRRHSEHHLESKKPKNIKSMFIDMHCSAEKQDKSVPFRDYFYKNPQFQDVEGLESFSKARDFGEKVSIESLREEVNKVMSSFREFIKFSINTLRRIKLR